MDAGDVYLADLNEEERRHVLVVSDVRFHRYAERAIIVPDIGGVNDSEPFPWRISSGEHVFAVDFVRALPRDRLLERVGRVDRAVLRAVTTALRQLT